MENEKEVGIDPFLLSLVACPQCKGALTPAEGGAELRCEKCALGYPVRSGVPVLRREAARPL